MTKLSSISMALLFTVAVASACSNSNTTTTPTTATTTPSTSSPACPSATALPSPPTLPGGFPLPTGVTLTGVQQAGPSTIVSGSFTGDLDQAFDGFETALTTANFTIEGSEQEEDDAEIAFSGGKSTGQVKMEVECEGRVDLTITIRPA